MPSLRRRRVLGVTPAPALFVWALLLPIVAAACFLRFYHLGTQSLWFDEIYSLSQARLDVVGIVRACIDYDTHPPLYYLALKAWISLFGDSEAAIRSLSAVAGVLLVLVAYALGKTLRGRTAGVLAALLVTLSPFLVHYSQEARMYALLALLAALSFLFLLRLLSEPTRLSALLYVGVTTLMLYTHLTGLFVLLAQILVVSLHLRGQERTARRGELRRWSLVLGMPLLLFVPWSFALARQTSQELAGGPYANLSWLSTPGAGRLATTFQEYAGSQNGLIAIGGLACCAVVAIVLAPSPSREQGMHGGLQISVASLWLVVPILVPFAVSYIAFSIYLPRYTITAALGFTIALALLGDRVPRTVPRLVIAAGLALVLAHGTVRHIETFKTEQWREAIATLDSRATPGDLVLLDSWFVASNAYRYYATRTDLVLRDVRDELVIGPDDPARVWLLQSHALEPELVDELRSLGSERLHLSFNRVELYLFDGTAPSSSDRG